MKLDDPDSLAELAKTAPPIAVGSLHRAGVQLSDWVLLATLAYTLLQTFFLIRDRLTRHKARKRKNADAANQ